MVNSNKDNLIGFFDSGFGGLNILRDVVQELSEYNYIYLGDTARAPYGSRSQEVIYDFTEQAVDFLFKKRCQLIILACNTASSEALHKIQNEYLPKHYPDRRVLGVIIPAAEEAVEKTQNKRIGIIATEGTVLSKTFEQEIAKLNSEIKVFQQACSLLVPLVEAGEQDSEVTEKVLEEYLNPLIDKQIDTLVLGCTHYGILKDKIKKIMGNKVDVVSEGEIVARKLKEYLQRHPEIESILSKTSAREFFTTDSTGKFALLGGKFFGQNIVSKHVELG